MGLTVVAARKVPYGSCINVNGAACIPAVEHRELTGELGPNRAGLGKERTIDSTLAVCYTGGRSVSSGYPIRKGQSIAGAA